METLFRSRKDDLIPAFNYPSAKGELDLNLIEMIKSQPEEVHIPPTKPNSVPPSPAVTIAPILPTPPPIVSAQAPVSPVKNVVAVKPPQPPVTPPEAAAVEEEEEEEDEVQPEENELGDEEDDLDALVAEADGLLDEGGDSGGEDW